MAGPLPAPHFLTLSVAKGLSCPALFSIAEVNATKPSNELGDFVRALRKVRGRPELQVNAPLLIDDILASLGLRAKALYTLLGVRGYLRAARYRVFAPTEQAQRVVERALGQYLHWEGSDECLREKGRATPLVLGQEGLGEGAVPPVGGGTLRRGVFYPTPTLPVNGEGDCALLFLWEKGSS